MNKQELIEIVAAETGLSHRAVETVLASVLRTIEETVASGEKVTFMGFGTFEARTRNSRQGRNMQTGEAIEIPATVKPRFRAGSTFSSKVAGSSKP